MQELEFKKFTDFPRGFVTWDPRKQLEEVLRRIKEYEGLKRLS